ncbi:MAG: DoxX family protein [Hyphomicrobiales bacterium]|nr:DoxX family protein [Hyphomicrobiales bacterium]
MNNPSLNNAALLAARILMCVLFVVAGYGKITGYAHTQAYMQSAGVPGPLLPLVIATELGGGLAILLGFQTRIVAVLLAGFTVLSALFFHTNFADQNQMINFMKNLAIAGGFLSLFVSGAGAWSLDGALRRG